MWPLVTGFFHRAPRLRGLSVLRSFLLRRTSPLRGQITFRSSVISWWTFGFVPSDVAEAVPWVIFTFLFVMNDAAVNIQPQVSVWTCFHCFGVYILTSEIAGSSVALRLTV